MPVPPEPIVGVITRSKGVSVHRIDCQSLDNVPSERLMDIKWADDNLNKTYVTPIRIDTANKVGMLKEILIALADCNTNIVYANVKAHPTKNLGVVEMGIEVDNISRLQKVIAALQALPDVYSVKRIQGVNSNKHAYNMPPQTKSKQQKTEKKTNTQKKTK